MAKPKKVALKEEAEEVLEEATVVRVVNANASHKADLELKLVYLRDLHTKMQAEGVNSLGTLEVVISKVIQELGTL